MEGIVVEILDEQQSGIFPSKELHLFAYAPDRQIIGGLFGDISWGWLHVSIIWVAESYRHHGIDHAHDAHTVILNRPITRSAPARRMDMRMPRRDAGGVSYAPIVELAPSTKPLQNAPPVVYWRRVSIATPRPPWSCQLISTK
jgi:hypothetical protein